MLAGSGIQQQCYYEDEPCCDAKQKDKPLRLSSFVEMIKVCCGDTNPQRFAGATSQCQLVGALLLTQNPPGCCELHPDTCSQHAWRRDYGALRAVGHSFHWLIQITLLCLKFSGSEGLQF